MITKIDIDHSLEIIQEARSFAREMNWQFHLTSAKECINVENAFESLVKAALRNKYGITEGDGDVKFEIKNSDLQHNEE